MSEPQMSREEFDAQLNQDTIIGLTADRVKYTGLISLARGYGRPDLVALLEALRKQVDEAIAIVEQLGTPAKDRN